MSFFSFHWVLFAIHKNEVFYYDSLKSRKRSHVVNDQIQFLFKEIRQQGGTRDDQTVRFHAVRVTQQPNSYDCGIFVIHFFQCVLQLIKDGKRVNEVKYYVVITKVLQCNSS
jgi:Ulp1 family protease